MEQLELEVTEREILGKKVRFLRRQGVTPLHVFGHGIDSMALQCDTAKLQQVLAKAGKTRLINLKLDKEKSPRPAVVREVQIEPLSGESLHVDFYQVQMAEQVKVEVPIVLTGEAPALRLKGNTLMHELNTLSVECLPAKIPTIIELDISSLTESEQTVRVEDIELDEGITVLNDPELVVARITARPEEKVEEAVVVEEAVEAPEEAGVPEEKSKGQ